MNYGQGASRIADEYGFEYEDVLTLLNGGVDEKKTIQVLSKKQIRDERDAKRRQKRDARERRAEKRKEKARKKKEAWTPSLTTCLLLSKKATERIKIAKKYGVEDPEGYVLHKAVPIRDTRVEMKNDWFGNIFDGNGGLVRMFVIVVLCGFTAVAFWYKLTNLSSPLPWYLCLAPVCLFSWICSLLIRYNCWTPKWCLRLCLKSERVMDKIDSVMTRGENRREEKRNEIIDRHYRIAGKYFPQKDRGTARKKAEETAEMWISLRSGLAGLIAGAATLLIACLMVSRIEMRLIYGLVAFILGVLIHYVFGERRLKKDDKYFERYVIRLRKKEAIYDVTHIDFVGDFMREWGFDRDYDD